jgi:hypothetical protein
MKTREEKRQIMVEHFDCIDLDTLTNIVLDKVYNEGYAEGVEHGLEQARQKTLQRDGYKSRKNMIGKAGEKHISNWSIDEKNAVYIQYGDLILASYEVKTETLSIHTDRVTIEVYDPVYKRDSGLRTSTAVIWYFCDYYEDGSIGLNFSVSTRRMKEVITFIKKEILPYVIEDDMDVKYEEMETAHNYYIPPYYFNMTTKQLQRQAKLTKFYYDNYNI